MSAPGASDIAAVIDEVRRRAPLVHCLTAAVSMGTVADATLASGARPMMTETEAEAPVVTTRADALLINLGTLSTDGAAGIEPTVAAARRLGHPWVLDPAAIGVAPVRTALADRLLDRSPTIVRCNGSEAMVLAGLGSGGKGADSTASAADAVDAGRTVAARSGAVVAISGPVDKITDGRAWVSLANGHPLLTMVTGTGCSLGAITAACAAVAEPFVAAVAAHAWVSVAGERAAIASRGPGSFRVNWLDELSLLSGAEIAAAAHLEES